MKTHQHRIIVIVTAVWVVLLPFLVVGAAWLGYVGGIRGVRWINRRKGA